MYSNTKNFVCNVDVLNKVCAQFHCHLRVFRSIAGVLTYRLGLYDGRVGPADNSKYFRLQTSINRDHFNIFQKGLQILNPHGLEIDGTA